MTGCQPHALGGDQVEEGIVLRRQMLMHCAEHVLIRVRSGYLQNSGVTLEYSLRSRAQATRDDDAAVLLQRLPDSLQRLIDRGVDKAAGVDDNDIGGVVAGSHLIPFSPQLRKDPLGIHQGLGAAEADESDFRCAAAGHARYRAVSPDGRAPGGNKKRAAMLDAAGQRRHLNRGSALGRARGGAGGPASGASVRACPRSAASGGRLGAPQGSEPSSWAGCALWVGLPT